MVDGLFAPWHIVIVGLLAVVVFGSKRLPESARAIGQSLRILKAETRELHAPAAGSAAVPVTSAAPAPAPVPPAPRVDAHTDAPLPPPVTPSA